MIRPYDLIDPHWTYISRTLCTCFQSLDNHFNEHLKETHKKLSESRTPERKFQNSEIINCINHWLEIISNAADESDMIWNISRYLVILDAEIAKMSLHIKYIFMENSWLKGEMFELQGRLMRLEHEFLIADAEKKFYQYFYNMRNHSNEKNKSYVKVDNIEKIDDEDSEPQEEIPKTMNALFRVVMQFISESRHMVAISWCQKSIDDYQRQYGEMSAEVGAIYTLLGRIYKDFGYYIIAQDIFEKALIIRERVHGKGSDHVAITLSLLGSVFGKREMFKEAIIVCKQALSIRESSPNLNQLEISRLNIKLAEYSVELKLWKETITYYKASLPFLEQTYEPINICIINCYTNLSRAYVEVGVLNKAADYLEKVSTSYVKKNNPGSSLTTNPFSLIVDCLSRKVQEFQVDAFIQKFGKVSSISDDKVVKVMILYFEKLNEPKTVDLLKSWLDISRRSLDRIDMKYSKLNMPITQPSSGRKLSKRESSSSLSHSIINIFKGNR